MQFSSLPIDVTHLGENCRLRIVADINITFEPAPKPVTGSGQHAPDPEQVQSVDTQPRSGHTAAGEALYEIDRSVSPPRVGSVNSAVWTLATQLRSPFTRDQFEGVVPKAMKYNPVTGEFGVRTKFENIKRARGAYFSEFQKAIHPWLVRVRPSKDEASEG